MDKFKFLISLTILNELGRNLYRKPITILGEAISNAWDAEAKRVDIYIDKEKNQMVIKDNGCGMDEDDFQGKFLTIGYSKRKRGSFQSDNLKRPYIGRKGIGKLALLSCSEKLHILSKKEGGDIVGGMISNTELDKEINKEDDPNKPSNYSLTEEYNNDDFNEDIFSKYVKNFNQGTIIVLDDLYKKINSDPEYYKKAIAFYFRFSIMKNSSFKIYINNDKANVKHLESLMEKTDIIWLFNGFKDDYLKHLWKLQSKKEILNDLQIKIPKEKIKPENMTVKGFIASANKPSDLKIAGLEEKAVIDFFVNGRLRASDILKNKTLPRIPNSYLYGQIHFDQLDGKGKPEIATASREDILPDNKEYNFLIDNLADIVNRIIFDQWDEIRDKNGLSGDDENKRLSLTERRAKSLADEVMKDFKILKNKYKDMRNRLREESRFNFPAYAHCYISENLLREHILKSKISLSKGHKKKIKKYRDGEEANKKTAKLTINIRKYDDDVNYLSMHHLVHDIDAKIKTHGAKSNFLSYANMYRPIRDAVMHTAFLTNDAKKELSETRNKIINQMNDILKTKKFPPL